MLAVIFKLTDIFAVRDAPCAPTVAGEYSLLRGSAGFPIVLDLGDIPHCKFINKPIGRCALTNLAMSPKNRITQYEYQVILTGAANEVMHSLPQTSETDGATTSDWPQAAAISAKQTNLLFLNPRYGILPVTPLSNQKSI